MTLSTQRHPLRIDPSTPLAELPVMLPGELTQSEGGRICGSHRWTVVAAEDEYATGKFTTLLPPEFYLRQLMDLNLGSDEALIDFMRRYGLLAVKEQPDSVIGGSATPQTNIAAARERAAVLRDVTRTLLANEGLLQPDELMARWESRGGGNPFSSAIVHESFLGIAVRLAATTITNALSPFGPSVHPVGVTMHEVFGIPLESAICAQMFNHLAESATYRRCAAPACARPFVRQVGRAKKGQHKLEGVAYCSQSCAQSAASKRYRERKKMERLSNTIKEESE